jgi:hypothetical protein
MQPNHIPTSGFKLPYYLTFGYHVAAMDACRGRFESPVNVNDGTKLADEGRASMPDTALNTDTEWVFMELHDELKQAA